LPSSSSSRSSAAAHHAASSPPTSQVLNFLSVSPGAPFVRVVEGTVDGLPGLRLYLPGDLSLYAMAVRTISIPTQNELGDAPETIVVTIIDIEMRFSHPETPQLAGWQPVETAAIPFIEGGLSGSPASTSCRGWSVVVPFGVDENYRAYSDTMLVVEGSNGNGPDSKRIVPCWAVMEWKAVASSPSVGKQMLHMLASSQPSMTLEHQSGSPTTATNLGMGDGLMSGVDGPFGLV